MQSFDTAWGESGLHPRAAIGQERTCVTLAAQIIGQSVAASSSQGQRFERAKALC